MRLHDLRPSFSQFTYKEEVDSKLLDHHDSKFTDKIYTKASLEKGKNVMDKAHNKIQQTFDNN